MKRVLPLKTSLSETTATLLPGYGLSQCWKIFSEKTVISTQQISHSFLTSVNKTTAAVMNQMNLKLVMYLFW